MGKRQTGEAAQCSDVVLLVRPAAFGFHAEAAASNAFASASANEEVAAEALAEFEGLRRALEQARVEVLVLDDSPNPAKPDAVFPNNWVSFHADGTMILYPMATARRRLERRVEPLKRLLNDRGFNVRRTLDLSRSEADGEFLEGTGSLILDRPRRRAYAAKSLRTDERAVSRFDEATGFETLLFEAADRHGRPIYHTNVLLSLGQRFAVVCARAIADGDRDRVLEAIEAGGREIITVDFGQMERFACNVLELLGGDGPIIAMSETALDSFDARQRDSLERHAALAAVPIPTIERIGGGSVRCMIADVHLPRLG